MSWRNSIPKHSVDSDPSWQRSPYEISTAIIRLLRLIPGSMVYDLAMDTLKARMATRRMGSCWGRASEKAIPAPERYGV